MRLSILTAAVAVLSLTLTGCGGGAPKRGVVQLFDSSGIKSLSTFFVETPATNQFCTRSTFSGCAVSECTFPSTPTGTGTIVRDSAGTVTAVGMLADGGVAIASTDTSVPLSLDPWAEGAPVRVSATGGRVPAFDNVSVIPPRPIALTTPACGFNCTDEVSTAEPMTLAWEGDAQATVVAHLRSNSGKDKDGATHHVSIDCTLASSPATISPAVLQRLQQKAEPVTLPNGATAPGVSYNLSLEAFNQTRFVAGEYDMELTATEWGGVVFFQLKQ